MTPPRDVQDYEAQARELLRKVHHQPDEGDIPLIAAALRAAERAALERAAQLVENDATYQERGDPRGMALSVAAQRIRALIAPAPGSPPAPDPFEGHSEAEVQAALDEVRGKAPAPDLRGLLIEARRFVSGERWATSAARRALIARIDAALSGPGAAPSKGGEGA